MGRPKKPRGVVFFEGNSEIDGKPIVGIATFQTTNEKTGPMIQTWILRSDIHPVNAIHEGEDESICGDCPLRGLITKGEEFETKNTQRTCYVSVAHAPRAVYSFYKKGGYETFDAEKHGRWFKKRGLRLGSYGDPVAIPLSEWKKLFELIGEKESQTGYTHQWKTCDQEWNEYIMASTHSIEENETAYEMGWRTFRTRLEDGEIADNEIVCPASAEADYEETCDTCGACNGGNNSRRSVVIVAHGAPNKMDTIEKTLIQLSSN